MKAIKIDIKKEIIEIDGFKPLKVHKVDSKNFGVARVGEERTITLGGLQIRVNVLDYKNSYGKDRWLVMPAGS